MHKTRIPIHFIQTIYQLWCMEGFTTEPLIFTTNKGNTIVAKPVFYKDKFIAVDFEYTDD